MSSRGRPPLAVWLYDTLIATLHDLGSRYRFVWEPAPAARWGIAGRVVGNLLEIGPAGAEAPNARVRVFLQGLLPEANQRTHHAHAAGVDPDDVFGLLVAFGRDTAGALVFQGVDEPPPLDAGTREPIGDDDIGELLRQAGGYRVDGYTPTSLAGVQPKVALYRDDTGWYRCQGAPTTHILKLGQPPGGPLSDVIDTEAACLDLARALTLTCLLYTSDAADE